MKRVLIVSLLMIAIAAGLGIYVLVYERNPAPAVPGEEFPVLIVNQEKPLERLTLIRTSDTIVLELVPGEGLWMLKKPVETFTDQYFIEGFLKELLLVKKEKLIDLHPQDLSPYQLDRPQAEVIYHFGPESPEIRLLVGKMNYNQTHYYAKLGSEPAVFLIPVSPINRDLFAPLWAFRIRSLFFHRPEDVLSIEIEILDQELKKEFSRALEPKLVVQKQIGKRPQWVILKPIQENAMFKSVNNFLLQLNHVSTQEVIDVKNNDYSPFGLDRPRARIILTMLDQSQEEIIFGKGDRENYVVYARNLFLPEVLPLSEDDFYDLINAHFRREFVFESRKRLNVSSLSIEFPSTPEKNFTLEREKDNVFSFADDPGEKAVLKAIYWLMDPFRKTPQRYLSHLEPLPRKLYGLDPALFRIKLYEEEALTMDVSIGSTIRVKGEIYTHFEDNIRKCIMAIPVDLVQTIPYYREHFIASSQDLKETENRRQRRRK